MSTHISLREAARRSGIPLSTLQRWVRAGRVEGATHFGNHHEWQVPVSALPALKASAAARSINIDRKEAKLLRLAVGISQRAAAEELGVAKSTFVRWETGEYKPAPELAGSYQTLLKQWAATVKRSETFN